MNKERRKKKRKSLIKIVHLYHFYLFRLILAEVYNQEEFEEQYYQRLIDHREHSQSRIIIIKKYVFYFHK